MTAKLYIGNIAYTAKVEDLSALFAQAGQVLSSRVIRDPGGRSRGFGFVEMSNQAEAQATIDRLNGHKLLGRALVVSLAHDDKELSRRFRIAKAREQYDRFQNTTPQPNTANVHWHRGAQGLNELKKRPIRQLSRERQQVWREGNHD